MKPMRMKHRSAGRAHQAARLGALPLALSLSLLAVACSSSSPSTTGSGSSTAGSSSQPYNVLVLAALSGPLASIAQAEVAGVKAAAVVVNGKGGILGRKVNLSIDNDGGDPTTALTDAQTAVNSGTPPNLVVAGTDGSETDAVNPVLTPHKILEIDPATPTRSAETSFAPYHFSSIYSDAAPNAAIVNQLEATGVKNVAVLVANDALGALTLSTYKPLLGAAGITYESASYPSGGTDFTPELLQLKAGHPQALIIDAIGTDAATATTSRAKIGWDIPTLGDSGYSASNVAALVPAADTSNIKMFAPSIGIYAPPSKQTPSVTQFYSAVKTQLDGPLVLPSWVYAVGYDAIMLAATGAKAAGSVEGPTVANALLNLSPIADPLYALFPYEHFDPSDHYLVLDKGDDNFISLTKLTGGFFEVPAGATP